MAAAKSIEENLPVAALKYQTWVLKVLIHCEGCKKMVNKVLQGIDGVYTTEIDSQQHKVTVTGDVDANTLIKRLSRSGKVAELWPSEKPQKKSKAKGSNNQKQDQKNSEPLGDDIEHDCLLADEETQSHKEDSECEDAVGANAGGGSGNTNTGGAKKKKNKNKKKVQTNGDSPINKGGGGENMMIDDAAAKTTGPSKSAGTESIPNLSSSMAAMDIGPPIQHSYPLYPPPPMYYSPAIPQAYGLSYNTAYPTSSSLYYAPPMHAYATYSHPPPPPLPPGWFKRYGDDMDVYEGGCLIM